MIKDKHQYHVCGWMINQLHLDGRELQCYAIIYSLSQLGEGRYIAGLKFLAEFMQCTQPTASSAIKALFNKGLIKKDEIVTEYGRRVFYYCADPDIDEECTNNQEGCKNNQDGVNKKFMDGVNKKFMDGVNKKFMSKYNKEENKKENKKGDNNKLLSPQKSRFKKPTIKEIAAYIEEKKFTFDAERFYDYYESKGWVVGKSPMKDWKAACRTWAAQRKSQIKEEDQEERSGLPAGLTEETWALRQEWMRKYVPRIAERISPEAFLSMQGKSHYNPEIFKDIIIEIDNSDYDGDIAQEFIRLCDTDEYAKRLWSGE